jgi:undecaprenyl-diphosphatase
VSLSQAVLLGVVEGVTEFLPVSSTGHLILASSLLGYDEARWATFNIVIQLGAILAVIVLYWRTFWTVLAGLARRERPAWAFLRNMLIAFLPAAVVGLALHKKIEALLLRPDIVAIALVVGGVAILLIEAWAKRRPVGAARGIAEVPIGTVVGIGIVQCLAMIPGVSRSGATIMGGVALGLERRTAAEFSFFLAIPTMLGATVVELAKNGAATGVEQASVAEIAVGFVVAFLVALAVIRGFVAIVSRRGFAPFAWYRIVAGALALVWLKGV